ncbi:MAG: thermonuclease family protein [Candidatus Margulisbacteria bacterium]|nr:thermonuclease family protein [Candidatus Margulisiibacteriota bacterium]
MKKFIVIGLLSAFGLFLLMGAILYQGVKQETIRQEPTRETKTVQQPQNGLHKVINVIDGDTIKVDINGKTETLRLIGIDTPETLDPRKPVQCFAIEASNKAKEILSGKNVSLEADSTQGERDKYSRLLRYVFLEDGTLYNQYMIEEGYAHEYTYQSNPYKYQTAFKEAEKNAREQGKGLWDINTCNGDTTQPADAQEALLNQDIKSEPQVKKSTSNICHEKGISSYYSNTKTYTPYDTIEDCFNSGGRLSKG